MTRRILWLTINFLFLVSGSNAMVQNATARKSIIEGIVTKLGTAEPLKGARVSLRRVGPPASGNFPIVYVTTDAMGHFSVSGLDAGQYRITTERDGYIRQEYGARRVGGAGMVVSVTAVVDLTLHIELAPGGAISGRILDESGGPVAGAQVLAQSYQYADGKRTLTAAAGPIPFGRSATTNDLGEYRLYWLPPGEYFISVVARGQTDAQSKIDLVAIGPSGAPVINSPSPILFPPVYFPGVSEPEAASPIRLAASGEIRGIDLIWRPRRTVTVYGRVNVPPSSTPSATQISLRGLNGEVVPGGEFLLSDDPSFLIRGVPSGSYNLTAGVRGTPQLFGQARIEVADRDVNLNLQAQLPVSIQGRIILDSPPPNGFQMSNLFIRAIPSERGFGGANVANVAADGAFTLKDIPPRAYRVSLAGNPDGSYLQSGRLGSVDVLSNGLVPTSDRDVLELHLGFVAGGVTGTVIDEKGAPYAGASVALVPDSPRRERLEFYSTVTTDQNGRFNFTSIPAGGYRLFAWEDVPPGAYQNAEFLTHFEAQGKPVHIGDASTVDTEIRLIPVPD